MMDRLPTGSWTKESRLSQTTSPNGTVIGYLWANGLSHHQAALHSRMSHWSSILSTCLMLWMLCTRDGLFGLGNKETGRPELMDKALGVSEICYVIASLIRNCGIVLLPNAHKNFIFDLIKRFYNFSYQLEIVIQVVMEMVKQLCLLYKLTILVY